MTDKRDDRPQQKKGMGKRTDIKKTPLQLYRYWIKTSFRGRRNALRNDSISGSVIRYEEKLIYWKRSKGESQPEERNGVLSMKTGRIGCKVPKVEEQGIWTHHREESKKGTRKQSL